MSDEDDDENWNEKETNKTTESNKEKIKNLTYTYNHTEQCVNIADTEGYLSFISSFEMWSSWLWLAQNKTQRIYMSLLKKTLN